MPVDEPSAAGGSDAAPPPSPAERYDDGVIALDTLTGGMHTVTAGFLLAAPRPALIECGPARSIGSVIAGLQAMGFDPDDLAYVVLTHIHLDHAGGAGDLAQAFPNATIVVSDVGAPHLHDPQRLNASSQRVYGPLYDQVYGACTPIERERMRGVVDGDRLDLGGGRELELLYTPGHAKHHVGVHDSETGAIFSGDSVGVKLPGMTHIRPATPPADFHLEAALASLARYREREPSRVYLAHYGPVDPPDEALAEADERLRLWAATAESAYRHAIAGGPTGTELDHVAETLRHRFSTEFEAERVPDDPDAERRIELLSGYTSNAAGMLRYFQRRDAGTLTPVG
ncbi:MAG TPA: MBL fold metallo-hydrolase [Egicoccus sp.]|nr:MBL fold metallo-hydrolase [Egicoccus sp.]HSK24314.1 MBL fold metallo-hydrolase [Egicoccus sp.]